MGSMDLANLSYFTLGTTKYIVFIVLMKYIIIVNSQGIYNILSTVLQSLYDVGINRSLSIIEHYIA